MAFSARICVIAAFALLSSLAGSAAVSAQAPTAVKTDAGLVSGVTHNGAESFKGIPFAAPPVGPLRWRAPQPAAAWSGIKAADRFGFTCMQPPRPNLRAEEMSEDCLTLNVWRPANARGKKLPVMVWIYGGAMVAGASSIPTYDGETFARNGVVLVSINYRVGRLGVFAHPALSAENADNGRLGNYALMDQIAGLQWVARNIAAFGGDPGNVTIFGESAGGLSIDTLMVTPEARGLFHRAIAESGYGRSYFPRLKETAPNGRRSAEADGVALAAALGVNDGDLAKLRDVPAAKIIEAPIPEGILYYIVDGKVLPHDIWEAFRAKKEAPVPFMIGSNSDEEQHAPWNNRRNDIAAKIDDSHYADLLQAYGGETTLTRNFQSDYVFTEQARALARMHVANGHPTFLYFFSAVSPVDAAPGRGAVHGSELRYVFGTLATGPKPITGAQETALSATMNAFWRGFAAKGAPTAAGQTQWPDYKAGDLMEFTLDGPRAHVDERNARLDALAKVVDDKS